MVVLSVLGAASLLVGAYAQTPTLAPTEATFSAGSAGAVDTSFALGYNANYYFTNGNAGNLVTDDTIPDFYLGYIPCPGPSVCVPSWIGNGHCDDCFGCDQYMVATGFYGDCSRCDYYWSGGAVGVGTFDGGDCGSFTFPEAVNNQILDECLVSTNLRTSAEVGALGYTQKRNTIIAELEKGVDDAAHTASGANPNGGWGTIAELQAQTDVQLASKCEYANIKECLRTNGWYDASTMASFTEGDLKFEAATQIETFSLHNSIALVYMSNKDLLEECIISGMTLKIIGFNAGSTASAGLWLDVATLAPMTAAEKRNYVISKLEALGKGTTAQLQTLHNAELRYLLNHIDGSTDHTA